MSLLSKQLETWKSLNLLQRFIVIAYLWYAGDLLIFLLGGVVMILCQIANLGVPCSAAAPMSAFGPLAKMIHSCKCTVYSDEGVAMRNRQHSQTNGDKVFSCPYKTQRDPVEAVKSNLNPLKAAKRAQRAGGPAEKSD